MAVTAYVSNLQVLRHTCTQRDARLNSPASGSRLFRSSHCRQLHLQPSGGRSLLSVRAEQQESTTQKAAEEDEVPIWVRRERERELASQGGGDLPFGIYLLASAIVAIAAVGSLFEFSNRNPIFGVVQPDNPLYTPILGLFAVTGLPTSGWLFYKSIQGFNKAAEDMDKVDGY